MDKNPQNQLTELQIRLTHMERDIESLNTVITKQDKILHELQRQLQLVYAQVNSIQESGNNVFNAATERPPHY